MLEASKDSAPACLLVEDSTPPGVMIQPLLRSASLTITVLSE